jgi:transglutaminase-like putative cysteine protease
VKYQIRHQTVYHYAEPVQHSVHELRLTPQSGPLQTVESWHVAAPGNLNRSRDGFGNVVHTFTLGKPTSRIVIEAAGTVDVAGGRPPDQAVFADMPRPGVYLVSPLYFASNTPLTLAPPEMVAFAAPYLANGATVATLQALCDAIADRVEYKVNTTDVGTTAAEAFALGLGVCQDQAQVMVACCRAHGVPARYVSGYFHAVDAPNLASHAWADVCVDVEQQRWCSFDVTHRCLTDHRHIRLAIGRDYQSAAPIRGIRHGGGAETMDVSITITPVDGD